MISSYMSYELSELLAYEEGQLAKKKTEKNWTEGEWGKKKKKKVALRSSGFTYNIDCCNCLIEMLEVLRSFG